MSSKTYPVTFAIIAAGMFVVTTNAGFAQSNSSVRDYATVKGWTIKQYSRSEGAGNAPSCSAVYHKNRLDSLRIERFRYGYLFGFNGLDRRQQGARYKLSYWFDQDKSFKDTGFATFVRDAAYPNSDWLSRFYSIKNKSGAMDGLTNKGSLSFSYLMPGNRTGNDEVTTTFKLIGSAAALLKLNECYQVAAGGGNGTGGTVNITKGQNGAGNQPKTAGRQFKRASDCPDDSRRLPGSRKCQGRAVNYLNIAGGKQRDLPPNCSWVVNEAAMPGGEYLLYLAAKCGRHTTKLEFSGGAKFGEISVVRSGLSQGKRGSKVITVGSVDKQAPRWSVLNHARNAMKNKAEAAKCRVVKVGGDGPSDAFVVDVSPQEAAKAPQGEPRSACGRFGLDQESTSYWRIFGGQSWFFELGQDAHVDFDPRSLTVIQP